MHQPLLNCRVMHCGATCSWARSLGAETSCASPRQTQHIETDKRLFCGIIRRC